MIRRATTLLLGALLAGHAAVSAQQLGLQLGAIVQSARRSAVVDTLGGIGNATSSGIEGSLQVALLRVDVRVLRGDFVADSGAFGNGAVTVGSATIGVGGSHLWLEGGIGRRALTGGFARRVWQYKQVGAGLRLPLAGPLSVQVRGAAYLSLKETDGPSTGSGRFAETSLWYAPAKLPVYFQVGYRAETLRIDGAGRHSPEEQSGLTAGGGIRVGRW